jgi:hypothetical protein
MTAIALAQWLAGVSPAASELTSAHTFFICPQINPDGSAENERWFADPLDPFTYFQHVMREPPGNDIEFGYPAHGQPALRPENEAVAKFLKPHGPYVFHASLHGMAFAEGAWFLIDKEHADRTSGLQSRLAALSAEAGLPLHDIQRHGEKGFTRIAKGFCTTPISTAMREYFLARNDADTAAQFRPSSMEFIQSLGGDPLLMVSELPLFLIKDPTPRAPNEPPTPGATAYDRFREQLPAARSALERDDLNPARALAREYQLQSVPLNRQVELQGRMVLEALDWLVSEASNP